VQSIQSLWASDLILVVAVYVLYCFDSVSRRNKDEMGITLAFPSEFVFTSYPFQIAGKNISAERIFQPWKIMVTEPLLPFDPLQKPRQSQLRLIRLIRFILQPFIIICVYDAILMLLVLPILILISGTMNALLMIGPLIYANSLLLIVLIYFSPFWKRLSLRERIGIITDLLLCPPYAINVAQKIAASIKYEVALKDFFVCSTNITLDYAPARDVADFLTLERGFSMDCPAILALIQLDKEYGEWPRRH
jgi:hypothetical protein